MVVASKIMLRPADAEAVSRSAIRSLLFLASAYFWLFKDNSYFAAPTDYLPLLHLWSRQKGSSNSWEDQASQIKTRHDFECLVGST